MPLNTPFDQVLMQIKDDPSLKWLEKMKRDPNKWNKGKYYRFHWDYGHDTDKCYDLKQQIEVLIKRGKLKNFLGQEHKDERLPLKGKAEEPIYPPFREIRVIIGGTLAASSFRSKKTYLRVVQNVKLIGCPPRAPRMDMLAITFTDEDARRLHHPYGNSTVKRQQYPLTVVFRLSWLKGSVSHLL